jgi:hypothetical protein
MIGNTRMARMMGGELTGVHAAGSTHRRDAESVISWQLTMQGSGQWTPAHQRRYQEWRKTEIEFWRQFCTASEKHDGLESRASQDRRVSFHTRQESQRAGC